MIKSISSIFPYASDAIYELEEDNCKFGCIKGMENGGDRLSPGGHCPILMKIIYEGDAYEEEEQSIEELTYSDGDMDCSEFKQYHPDREPLQVETLF